MVEKKEKNPFLVLGIAPGTLYKLSDERIATLVRHVYRGQIAIHHQDVGGGKVRHAELNEAMEKLDQTKNPQTYQYWKKAFLRKKEEKLEDFSKELQEAQRIQRAAQDQQYEFWKAFAGINESKQGFSIFNLFSACFLVSDTLQSMLRSRVSKTVSGIDRTSQLNELEVDPLGAVSMFPLIRVPFKDKSEIPFGTPPEWILDKDNRLSAYLKRAEGMGGKLDNVRIVGSISDVLLKSDEWNKVRFKGLFPGITQEDGITGQDFDDVKNGFNWERFRPYSVLVSPVVTVKDYLVGLRAFENEARFIIFGHVQAIKSL